MALLVSESFDYFYRTPFTSYIQSNQVFQFKDFAILKTISFLNTFFIQPEQLIKKYLLNNIRCIKNLRFDQTRRNLSVIGQLKKEDVFAHARSLISLSRDGVKNFIEENIFSLLISISSSRLKCEVKSLKNRIWHLCSVTSIYSNLSTDKESANQDDPLINNILKSRKQ